MSNVRTLLFCLKTILITQGSTLSATEFDSIAGTNVSNCIIKVSVRFREMETFNNMHTVQIKEGKETAVQTVLWGHYYWFWTEAIEDAMSVRCYVCRMCHLTRVGVMKKEITKLYLD